MTSGKGRAERPKIATNQAIISQVNWYAIVAAEIPLLLRIDDLGKNEPRNALCLRKTLFCDAP